MLTSSEPAPVALVGELLATQAQTRGVAGILVDGAVRDLDELAGDRPADLGAVRARAGRDEGRGGELDVPVVVGGAEIRPGDLVVLDCDGAMALPSERVDEVLPLALERAERERAMRERYAAGELSYDLQGAARARRGLMDVAVLGLGEAGGRIAADLVAAGCDGARLGSGRAGRRASNAARRSRGGPRRRRRPQRQRRPRSRLDGRRGRRRRARR